jgi:hypothetical protein
VLSNGRVHVEKAGCLWMCGRDRKSDTVQDKQWSADHGALPSDFLNIIRMRAKVDLRKVLPATGKSGPEATSYPSRTRAATQLHQTGHSRSAQHL